MFNSECTTFLNLNSGNLIHNFVLIELKFKRAINKIDDS